MLNLIPLLIALLLAPQPPSPLDSGRQLTQLFYAGRNGDLWERIGEPMRATLRSEAGLAELRVL